jgi:hypothetical protein
MLFDPAERDWREQPQVARILAWAKPCGNGDTATRFQTASRVSNNRRKSYAFRHGDESWMALAGHERPDCYHFCAYQTE